MRYWLQRLVMVLLLLLAVSLVTFAAMNVLGDPLFNILGPVAGDTENPESLAKIEAAKEQYYLDRPFIERYGRWLGDFVTGDMGVRFSSDGQPPVTDFIAERLPRSFLLMAMALAMAVVIAIPWGLATASRPNTRTDKMSTFNAFLLVSLPSFALGLILKYIFAIKLGWFPLAFNAGDSLGRRLHAFVLPALTLALPAAAVYQRLLRTDLITTLQEDFILMARAKGVSRRNVLFRHALRPSMFSMITIFGLNAGALIGGSLIVEQIFEIPGIGRGLVEAILREDFPVVLAIVMIVAATFVILNFLIDLLYSVLDPRVRV